MWIDTWKNWNWDVNSLIIPKNPTKDEIKLVIKLCNEKLKILLECTDKYTEYIESYKQQQEAEENNERIYTIVRELRTKLKAFRTKYNINDDKTWY